MLKINFFIFKNTVEFNKKNNYKLVIKNNFNKIFKLNYLNFNKNIFYYKFDLKNKKYFLNLIKFLNYFFENNGNMLIIDNNYKFILPIYNFLYGFKNIYSNKNFFFLKKNYLLYNNWLYLYKNFLIKFGIKSIIFFNFIEFNNFFKIFLKLNISLIGIVPQNFKPTFLDHYIFATSTNLQLTKFILFSYFINLYFYNYNINLKKNKLLMFNFFKKL